MKLRTVSLVVVALVAGTLNASFAQAKPGGKPVSVTHYFHGTQDVGEVQSETEGFGVMNTTPPTGTSARSFGLTNYVGGPNTECAGNSLFPVWIGAVNGTPTGNATVQLFLQTYGTGGSFEVRLFSNVEEQACNEEYPGDIGSETVTFASGQNKATVVLKNINRKHKPVASLMLQVTPVLTVPPYVARVQYDSTTANSHITFNCVPKAGKKTC
jgi:hypothetical protein